MLWIADLHENEIGPNIKWNKIINEFEASYSMSVFLCVRLTNQLLMVAFFSIANDGTTMYVRTNKDAPQYKLAAFDLADGAKSLRDVIPEDSGALLNSTLALQDGKLAVVYQRNVGSLFSCRSPAAHITLLWVGQR